MTDITWPESSVMGGALIENLPSMQGDHSRAELSCCAALQSSSSIGRVFSVARDGSRYLDTHMLRQQMV